MTLVELLVVVSLVAILLAMAGPAYVNMVRTNQMAVGVNNLAGGFHFARSEAAKRGGGVAICASSDGLSCSTNWSKGWLVWLDDNASGTLGKVDAGEEILKVGQGISEGMTLSRVGWTSSDNFVGFSNQGLGSSSGDFVFCDARGSSSAKVVNILVSGRAQVSSRLMTGATPTCS